MSSADRLMNRIEALDTASAENRQRAESYERMTEELKQVEVTVTSPDGVVTVVAGPGGEVRSITFTEEVKTIEPAALSKTTLHTLAKARADAAKAQAEVVRDGLGDAELLNKVIDSDERLFGDAPATDPGPAPTTPRVELDDDEGYQIFRDRPSWEAIALRGRGTAITRSRVVFRCSRIGNVGDDSLVAGGEGGACGEA